MKLRNEKTDVKNESSFEVIRGVVLAFYRFEIFCEEKKLGFGLEMSDLQRMGSGVYFENRP